MGWDVLADLFERVGAFKADLDVSILCAALTSRERCVVCPFGAQRGTGPLLGALNTIT